MRRWWLAGVAADPAPTQFERMALGNGRGLGRSGLAGHGRWNLRLSAGAREPLGGGAQGVCSGVLWGPAGASAETLTAPSARVYRGLIWCHILFAERAESSARPPARKLRDGLRAVAAAATATLAWTTDLGSGQPTW